MNQKQSIVWQLIFSCFFLLTIEKANALGSQISEGKQNKFKYRGIFNRQKDVDISNLNAHSKVLQVPVDHFNATTTNDTDNQLFDLRYIYDLTYSSNTSSTPILFYCGNEGDIGTFYNNSGFITTTLAQKLQAAVLFVEHRYYGQSYPFNNKTIAFEQKNLRFLSIQQVFWDYMNVIDYFKDEYSLLNSPVIAFGGSYGGMLAAWMRMKYPNYIQGAIASSAPILWFKGVIDPNAYTKIASNVILNQGGQQCYDNVKYGFFDLQNLKNDNSSWQSVESIFNLCHEFNSTDDFQVLIDSISDDLGTMAMVNYPYSTSFIEPLPAWPIQAACNASTQTQSNDIFTQNIKDISAFDYSNVMALQRAVNVFYNYTKQLKCLDLTSDESGGLDTNGWSVQTCNEFPMPMGDDPSQGCFTWKGWYEAQFTQNCKESYGMTPKYDWALDFFGGRDVSKDFASYSNIVFSNGQLDPWQAGGITQQYTTNPSIKVLLLKDSAHHLDLRLPNDADPAELTDAREVELQQIQQWINQWNNQQIGLFIQK